VYAVGHTALTLEGRFLAAVKACGPAAALSHFAAAVLWDIADWTDRVIQVTVPIEYARRHRGLRIHRSSRLDVGEVTRHQGIRVTTPARTILDLAAGSTDQGLRRLVRESQSRKLVNVRTLNEALARHPGRRGSARVRRLLLDGPAPTRTELEDMVLALILKAGLPHPDVNVPMRLDGRRVVPDFRWPSHRLVVEADSAAWHDNKQAREDDAERQALLEAHGERVLRVTWKQAVAQPAQTAARLRAAFA
jgi:hypothetical protein